MYCICIHVLYREIRHLFLDTPRTLRSTVHSLLKDPFNFHLSESIHKFDSGQFLDGRTDKDELLALSSVYDSLKIQTSSKFPHLIYDLENKYHFKLTAINQANSIVSYHLNPKVCAKYDFDAEKVMESNVVSRQLDRLYDYFSLKACGNQSPTSTKELYDVIKFLILNELLALSIAGKLQLSRNGNNFHFSVKNGLQRKVIDRHLFAKSMAQESSNADIYYVKLVSDLALSPTRDCISYISEIILNKELFIKKVHLKEAAYDLKITQYMLSLIQLISALLIFKVKNTSLRMKKEYLSNLGLDYRFVREFVIYQKQCLITDQFIECRGDEISIILESWASNLSALLKSKAEEFKESSAVGNYLGGKFFEVGYIYNELKNRADYRDRFVVQHGFDRNQVISSYENEADVDIILFDKKLKHYYFLQVKYTMEGNTPYFEGVMKRLQSDISNGLKQISEAKRLLESGQLSKTLEDKGFQYPANIDNSSFLLIHNLPDFDYQRSDYGIGLYDWNSFRNLILDFRIFLPNETGVEEVRGNYNARLCDPDVVIQSFFEKHMVFKNQKENVLLASTSELVFSLGEYNFFAKGVGI